MDIRKFVYEKRSKTAVFDLKLLIFTLIFDIAKPESRRERCGGTYRKCEWARGYTFCRARGARAVSAVKAILANEATRAFFCRRVCIRSGDFWFFASFCLSVSPRYAIILYALTLERCLRGRKSTIGNRVYVKSVPRVRIPLSPPNKS